MGETRTALKAGPVGRWDRGKGLEINLFAGTLAAQRPIDVLGGANRLALKTENGWEIVQFAKAELIADGHYRLSELLRGQFGSEAAMVDKLPSGAACVVLSPALQPLSQNADSLQALLHMRFGPSHLPMDSYAWQRLTVAPSAPAGLFVARAFAPHHAERPAGGLAHQLVRRSRFGGDDFDAVEIPLDEPPVYVVSIYNQKRRYLYLKQACRLLC